jgi:hypothetical protein
MNIEQLKAQVKAAQEANKAKIDNAVQIATLTATLKLEASELLFNSKVKLAVTTENTDKLQALVTECSGIIDSIPVTNNKTRTARVWAGSRRYAFGSQINLMYQLATGILYSCADHKQLLLAHTGLNLELLEQVNEAFGTPAYYSRNYNKLVESNVYSVENVVSTISVMQSELGVIVDSSLLTEDAFYSEFDKAQIVAETNKIKSDEAIAEAEEMEL